MANCALNEPDNMVRREAWEDDPGETCDECGAEQERLVVSFEPIGPAIGPWSPGGGDVEALRCSAGCWETRI